MKVTFEEWCRLMGTTTNNMAAAQEWAEAEEWENERRSCPRCGNTGKIMARQASTQLTPCPNCWENTVKKPMHARMRTYLEITGEGTWYEAPERTNDEIEAFIRGMAAGFRCYAWWQDGKQFVGTTGTKLDDALTVLLDEDERQRLNGLDGTEPGETDAVPV